MLFVSGKKNVFKINNCRANFSFQSLYQKHYYLIYSQKKLLLAGLDKFKFGNFISFD